MAAVNSYRIWSAVLAAADPRRVPARLRTGLVTFGDAVHEEGDAQHSVLPQPALRAKPTNGKTW